MTVWNETLKNKLMEQGVTPKKEITDKADVLYEELTGMPDLRIGESDTKKIIAVYGGSGVGKSSIAQALACLFENSGKNCYVLHGDNYPHRIPCYNDAERMSLFREYGIRKLIAENIYNSDVAVELQQLQMREDDFDVCFAGEYPWLETYIEGGIEKLSNYLGTDGELDFDAVNSVTEAFKSGMDSIWVRNIGREAYEVMYQKKDISNTDILIIEWTHGYSPVLTGIDKRIFLKGSPEETLSDRIKRGRDKNTASPFISIVLDIEQAIINKYSENVDISMTKEGIVER